MKDAQWWSHPLWFKGGKAVRPPAAGVWPRSSSKIEKTFKLRGLALLASVEDGATKNTSAFGLNGALHSKIPKRPTS